jgi:hypothetical protein
MSLRLGRHRYGGWPILDRRLVRLLTLEGRKDSLDLVCYQTWRRLEVDVGLFRELRTVLKSWAYL